ncbi:MAG TPA: outer membrane beta-barrel protein [Candidatus Krumholzibacteria bacterium]|nr:outer membrane beta-barrel protein [Candidatus Krumholzibacteria bacterium]
MKRAPILIASFIAMANVATAANTDSLATSALADTSVGAVGEPSAARSEGLTYLVPAMKDAGWKVTDDRNRFKHRISFSPAYGKLGSEDLFAFRIGYSPNTWLGYEASLGHNPASSLHGMLHTFNVILRYPLSGRFQPYATIGYGMMTVYPGQAINADPVTKNALAGGGGLELYIRNDVAVRAEVRGATVLGQQLHSEGTVAYDYLEYTIGFAFFRSLGS